MRNNRYQLHLGALLHLAAKIYQGFTFRRRGHDMHAQFKPLVSWGDHAAAPDRLVGSRPGWAVRTRATPRWEHSDLTYDAGLLLGGAAAITVRRAGVAGHPTRQVQGIRSS